jgi:hypothetical protein
MSDAIDPMIMDEARVDTGARAGEGLVPPVEPQAHAEVALDRVGQAALARQLVAQARAQGLELVGPAATPATVTAPRR